MYFDGVFVCQSAGAGAVLISPAKDKLYYTMQLYFQHGEKVSNNIAEYEGLVARLKAATALGSGASESTTTPWVILVINVNISLVVLILLSSIFKMSSIMEWLGQEDVESLLHAKERRLAKAQNLKTLHFIF